MSYYPTSSDYAKCEGTNCKKKGTDAEADTETDTDAEAETDAETETDTEAEHSYETRTIMNLDKISVDIISNCVWADVKINKSIILNRDCILNEDSFFIRERAFLLNLIICMIDYRIALK